MDKEITKLLKFWQHNLKLDDWVIVLKDEVPATEMTLQNVAGETEWQEVNKCAVIKLLSKQDYGDRIIKQDKEKTLVHELLHCKFCLLGESGNDLQDRLIHQMIEDLAKSLVDAKRGKL